VLARRKENLDAIEKQIANTKGFKCDVSNVDEINSTVEAIIAHYGAIDVLIVNTSGGAFTSFDKTSQADFEMAMKSGPTALFALAKAVTPGMLARGSGVIGVTGATAAWRGMPHTYSKASSNFAMRALCQSLARDMAPRGIHVFHVVVDGLVSQPRTHGWLPKKPKEEFLRPEAIAETYYALATQPPSCWTSELNIVAGPVFGSSASI
jgi:NADP-dependent 3-hydroxy acid dehydrogenase YdfG